MSFFQLTSDRTVQLEDFCREFVQDENFSTTQEADMVLTTILAAFDDYKRQKPADPARAKKLSEMLCQIFNKGKAKYVCALFSPSLTARFLCNR